MLEFLSSLPLELIDKIITINPNLVINTYSSIIKSITLQQTNPQELVDIVTTRSRKRKYQELHEPINYTTNTTNTTNYTNNTYNNNTYNNTIKIYLLNPSTRLKYFSQSSWFKYFIDVQTICTVSTTKISKHIPSNTNIYNDAITNKIDKTIFTVLEYFHLLERYYKKIETNTIIDQYDLLNKLENILVAGKYNNSKVGNQLNNLVTYYKFRDILDIPYFLRLVIILYNSEYFTFSSTSKGNSNNKSCCKLHDFLEMILEEPTSEIVRNYVRDQYTYYNASYQFIPLFTIYLGLGYTFAIGWDFGINNMVGIIENGSSGHEIMANVTYAMRYFRGSVKQREKHKKNTKKIINEYLCMLGNNNISYLEERAMTLNFATPDMF